MEKKVVLIVDDSQEILDALSEYLERSNFSVLTAMDGERMWELLKSHTP